MTTATPAQLKTDKTVSIVLMIIGGMGTIVWAPFSLMLALVTDSGVNFFTYVFLFVAWFGPAIATIGAITHGVIALKKKTGRAWVRVLIWEASAPVAIIVLGIITSSLPTGN